MPVVRIAYSANFVTNLIVNLFVTVPPGEENKKCEYTPPCHSGTVFGSKDNQFRDFEENNS